MCLIDSLVQFQSGELMAQFSSVKRLFSGDALSVSGFESKKDPFHHHCKVKDFGGCGGAGLRFTTYSPSIKRRNHDCKLGFLDSFAVHASYSSDPRNYSDDISYEILLEEPVELERDDLSGFRGLVLDISYRSAFRSLLSTLSLCADFYGHSTFQSAFELPPNTGLKSPFPNCTKRKKKKEYLFPILVAFT